MKKILIGIVVVLGLVVAVGALGFWWFSRQPLYQPGMVAAEENLRAPLDPPAQTGGENFWQVENDIQLHYFTAGEGHPVLMVHGGPGAPFEEAWPGLTALEDEYAFYYYDQRGGGGSTKPIDTFASTNFYSNVQELDAALGLGAHVADIERARRLLGEEKLILIGHSFGGFIAAMYAAEFPENVAALVLVAPADILVFPQPDGRGMDAIRPLLSPEEQAAFDAYLEEYFDFSDVFSKSEAELAELNAGFLTYYAAALDLPLEEDVETAGWVVQGMYFSLGQTHDYRDALKNVEAPVLVIHGAGDLQPEEASRLYADLFPNASFEILEESTHFPFIEQPEAFGALVAEFLAGCCRADLPSGTRLLATGSCKPDPHQAPTGQL